MLRLSSFSFPRQSLMLMVQLLPPYEATVPRGLSRESGHSHDVVVDVGPDGRGTLLIGGGSDSDDLPARNIIQLRALMRSGHEAQRSTPAPIAPRTIHGVAPPALPGASGATRGQLERGRARRAHGRPRAVRPASQSRPYRRGRPEKSASSGGAVS